MEWSFSWISGAVVGAIFLVSGTIELVTWRKFVDQFTSWGYPPYWPLITFALKVAGGILVFIPQSRMIGLIICIFISSAAVATLLVNPSREAYLTAVPINIVLIGLAVASLIMR